MDFDLTINIFFDQIHQTHSRKDKEGKRTRKLVAPFRAFAFVMRGKIFTHAQKPQKVVNTKD